VNNGAYRAGPARLRATPILAGKWSALSGSVERSFRQDQQRCVSRTIEIPHSGVMTSSSNNQRKRLIAFAAFIVIGLVAGNAYYRNSRRLTATEQRLVGVWTAEDDAELVHTLTADRRYRDNTGFAGNWAIESGRLRLRYWSDQKNGWEDYLVSRRFNISVPLQLDQSGNRCPLARRSRLFGFVSTRRPNRK